ncbi:hypothetical protein HDV06_001952, partial [Boothiomyces sp. JEL0866]
MFKTGNNCYSHVQNKFLGGLNYLSNGMKTLEQKLEALEERKLELEIKQVQEGLSSAEKVKNSRIEERQSRLEAKRIEMMDIIEIAIKKESDQKEEKYYEFRGKVVGSKSVKGIRKTLYRFAQTHSGYYHPVNKALEYEDGSLLVDIVFKTDQEARNFQTEFEFINTNISYSDLETESDVVAIDL